MILFTLLYDNSFELTDEDGADLLLLGTVDPFNVLDLSSLNATATASTLGATAA